MKKLKAIDYRVGYREIISPLCFYYLGQLWDGEGDGEELLDSGVIFIVQDGNEYEVWFKVTKKEENISDTLVFVTAVYEVADIYDE